MTQRRSGSLAFIVVCAAVVQAGLCGAGQGLPAAPASGADATLRTGTWGGRHIGLEVGRDARVDYDCGHGTIDGPLTLDAEGRFAWTGAYVREHPGPQREGEEGERHPARYTGRVEGDSMELTVTQVDSGERVGTFTLVYNQPPRVMKCL